MTKEVIQQARYVLTKANVGDLIAWLRAGKINRAVIALEHLNPAIEQPATITEREIEVCFPFSVGWNSGEADKVRYRRVLETYEAIAQPVQSAVRLEMTKAEVDGIIKSVDCSNGGDNWDGDAWDDALVRKAFAAGVRAANPIKGCAK